MQVATWNIRDLPLQKVSLPSFNIAVLTEVGAYDNTNYSIITGGKTIIGGREKTKVAIVSRAELGSHRIPPGFHEGRIVETRANGITIVGVCIPWSGAYRLAPWSAFTEFCNNLKPYLAELDGPIIVAGDFNASPSRNPRAKHMIALQNALSGLSVVTQPVRKENGRPLIDHIATNLPVGAISLIGDNAYNPSDHVGAMAEIRI